MGIYLLCLALIIGLKNMLNLIKLKDKKKTYVIIVSVCLFLVLALRDYSVGRDLRNYIPRYAFWGRLNWEELWNERYGVEFGYVLLNKLLYLISPSPRLLLIFCAAVQMICYGYAVYKESENPQFSFFIFITLANFQGCASSLRQSTAMCILMVAYHYIAKKNIKNFIILVVLACMLHKSALIFLPLYFLYGKKLRLRTAFTILTSYLLCLLYGSGIIKFIIRYTGYIRYFLNDYSLSNKGEMGLLVMTSALIIVFLLVYAGDYDIEFSFSMFMLLIMEFFIILTFYLTIVARVINYFMYIATIAIPNLTINCKSKYNKDIIRIATCVIFLLYYILILAKSDARETFKYKFMWQ